MRRLLCALALAGLGIASVQAGSMSLPAAASSSGFAGGPAHDGGKLASEASGPYLHDLLKMPMFADAYRQLIASAGLPGWVRTGGTSTPAQRIQINGKPWLLAESCKPHDCPSEHIHVLFEPRSDTMVGMFVRDPGAAPQASKHHEDKTELIWLGAPDGQMKNALLHALRFTE
ncbi:MAG: hypothetical protein KGQ45_05560 [Burkholderiales bacterium]|nr:hypothetical protein [Burkholderiales bacterium]